MDKEPYVSLADVDLCYKITREGTEIYSNQAGTYQKYLYNGDVYILTVQEGLVNIEMADDSVEPDDTELPF
jgi:hypothetical protein